MGQLTFRELPPVDALVALLQHEHSCIDARVRCERTLNRPRRDRRRQRRPDEDL